MKSIIKFFKALLGIHEEDSELVEFRKRVKELEKDELQKRG